MRFADHALARRLEAADAEKHVRFVEARSRLATGEICGVIQVGGGVGAFAGTGIPYSRAVGLGLGSPVSDEELDQLAAFYQARGAAACVSLCPLAAQEMIRRLGERGYRLDHPMHTWFRELQSGWSYPPPPPQLSVRVIVGGEEPRWVQTALDLDISPPPDSVVSTVPHMRGASAYLASIADEPAGAGMMLVHEGVACLFSGNTRVRFRQQGLQHALLAARLSDAASQGCDLAMVHTEPGSPSQRNVERMGFRLAYTLFRLERPPD